MHGPQRHALRATVVRDERVSACLRLPKVDAHVDGSGSAHRQDLACKRTPGRGVHVSYFHARLSFFPVAAQSLR